MIPGVPDPGIDPGDRAIALLQRFDAICARADIDAKDSA
jgi:hypothetical protein